jgi:tetratricopeptide (TPR) repeat protein
VAALLTSIAAADPPASVVHALHRETEGNPFFLEEVVRHLDEQGKLLDRSGAWQAESTGVQLSVPDTIRLTIGRRLDGLGETTRGILTIAAIIGRGFGFELLEELADATEDELLDALDEAERANVITSTTEAGTVRFRFAHELTRQTLVADVSLTRRQLFHLRVADAMERVYASSLPEHASELAYHLVEAGRRADQRKTIQFLVLAGERALEAAAYEDAARHLDRALSVVPSDDLTTRAPILETLAMAERSLGQPEDAIATWNEALDAFETIGDTDTVARLCMDAGIQVAFWARTGDARRLVTRGLNALGDRENAHRAGLIALDAIITGNAGDYERAERLLEQALAIARRHADDRVLGRVLYSKAAHHFTFLEQEKTIETGTESIEHLRRAGDLWNLTNVLGFVGQSLGFVGRFDEAARVTEGSKQLAERMGNWVAYIYIDRARAWRHLAHNPDANRLEADGQRDLDLGNKLGYRWMSAVGYTRMSFASFVKGHWDDAIARAHEAAALEAGPLQGHLGRLVLLCAYRGENDEALRYYEELRRWEIPEPGTPSRFGVLNALLAAMEGLALIGEYDEAGRLYPWALEATAPGMRIFRGWDYRLFVTLAGIGAACARRYEEAEEHFRQAIRIAEDLPYVLEQPEAYRFYARMLLERDAPGDRDKAEDFLKKAIVSYRSLGMPKHEELTNAMLAQIA